MLNRTRDALLTAFMTGNLFIVLPALAEQTKALLSEYAPANKTYDQALADVIVPASFNFPHTGKLLAISFVLFAGWSSDAAVPLGCYPALAATGLLVLFGNVNGAVPFLLDTFHIPADTFQLFLATGIVNARFGTLVAAVHTLTLGLLGTWAIAGQWQVSVRKLVRYGLVTATLAVVVVLATRAVAARAVGGSYQGDRALMTMKMLNEHQPARIDRYPIGDARCWRDDAAPGGRLMRIRAGGVLRVGYLADSLPFAFVNARGDLVGFDIEMAHILARTLASRWNSRPSPATTWRRSRRRLLRSRDVRHCRHDVSSGADDVLGIVPGRNAGVHRAGRHARGVLELGIIRSRGGWARGAAPAVLHRKNPPGITRGRARADPVGGSAVRGTTLGFDAVVLTAERGSAWTLLHPQYSVTMPMPHPIKVPLAYPIAAHDEGLAKLVNTWIELKQKDGTIDALFAHWIRGAPPRYASRAGL